MRLIPVSIMSFCMTILKHLQEFVQSDWFLPVLYNENEGIVFNSRLVCTA